MRDTNKARKIIESAIISIIPLVIISVGNVISSDTSIQGKIIMIVIAYIITAISVFSLDKYFTMHFRLYKKYEGTWIEIIPSFKRPISICKIYYDKDGYHFCGTNFYSDEEHVQRYVDFQSLRFIESNKRQFYFITNASSEDNLGGYEGFGKIKFNSKDVEGYYTGSGFFLDVDSNIRGEKSIYQTIMIKWEREFYEGKLKIHKDKKPQHYNNTQVYNCVKDSALINRFLQQK